MAETGTQRSATKKRTLTQEEKKIIFNLYDNLKESYSSKNEIVRYIVQVMDCSKATVFRVLRKGVPTPVKKSTGRPSIIKNLDDFDKSTVRKIVHDFYRQNNIPCLDKLYPVVNASSELPNMSRTTVYNLLRELNITYTERRKTCVLIEDEEVIMKRREYLREIQRYRTEGRKIYYLDEIWLEEKPRTERQPKDSTPSRSRRRNEKTKRLALLHMASDDGFVEDGLLTLESDSSIDYEEAFNAEIFETWLEPLLGNLQPSSVVIMDNASYHSRKADTIPTSANKREDIMRWLQGKGVEFDNAMGKGDLMCLVRSIKDSYNFKVVDELVKSKGHCILRIPTFHAFLNPFNMLRSFVKEYLKEKGENLKFIDIEKYALEAFAEVDAQRWKTYMSNLETKVEKDLWDLDSHILDIVRELQAEMEVESSSSKAKRLWKMQKAAKVKKKRLTDFKV